MIISILDKELKRTTIIGVVTLDESADGKKYLQLNGFAGITDDSHIVLRDDGNILTMEIAPDASLERCVVFNQPNKESQILIDYFQDFDAVGSLFVRVGNTYIQCKGVKVKD